MKKRTILILAVILAIAASGCFPALAAEEPLFSWNGVKLIPLQYSYFDGDTPMLTLHLRVANDTDRKLWIGITDAEIDGVPVRTFGRSIDPHTDTGTEEPKYYSFMGSEDDGGAGYEAIRNARIITMKILVEDNDSYEKLYEQEVTFDIATLTNGNEPKPTAKPTPKTTAPPKSASPSDYKLLKRGDKGESVRQLQQRLLELGYLQDKVDGSFGKKTAAAVMVFCDQNKLSTQGGDATPEMQALLFSSDAEIYMEPYVPLVIGSRFNWKGNRGGASLNFRIEVTNRSLTRTIRGFELFYYMTDVFGNHYSNEHGEVTKRQTMSIKVKPGDVVYSDYMYIYPATFAHTVWVGVSKIVFDDGEIREVEDIHYYSCEVK